MNNTKFCAEQHVDRWKELLQRWKDPPKQQQQKQQQQNQQENESDPFDCRDLISTNQIPQLLQGFVEQWKELDSRMVVASTTPLTLTTQPEGKGCHNRRKEPPLDDPETTTDGGGDYGGLNWGWHANRIRLPDYFDYQCHRGPPPTTTSTSSSKKRRTVVSATDPSIQLDYETELYKLFQSVPTASMLERQQQQQQGPTNSIAMCDEIKRGFKEYTRMDCHALSRLRKKERHHWPPVYDLDCGSNDNVYEIDEPIVKLECWRRDLKRGSQCDSAKCEMEFLGSQTLWHVHQTICQMGGTDPLFPTTGIPNGLFFIEDTFYTSNDTATDDDSTAVDYATPIINWLDATVVPATPAAATVPSTSTTVAVAAAETSTVPSENNTVPSKKRKKQKKVIQVSRREYLGIPKDTKLKVVSMKDALLSQLSMRLGVRYYHVYNGTVECAVFFTDVSMNCANEVGTPNTKYPLIHDTWTTTEIQGTCDACTARPPLVVTIQDELTNGGPTYLCSTCYNQLHYHKDGTLKYNNFQVYPISVIQTLMDEIGTSTHEATDTLF